MADYLSTSTDGAPEYLEAGGGSPLPPTPPAPPTGGGRRRRWLVGGGVALAAVVGVGAWAAAQFFATGAQPSEALPSTTVGYASVDLDPSGGQKIEALRTLNKFPAFKGKIGLSTGDDIREKIFDSLDLPASCHLFYDQDVKPWLGERLAVAAVPVAGKAQPVAVLQVHDQDAAAKTLGLIQSCSIGTGAKDPADLQGGCVFEGDWVVIAETKAIAQSVVDATGHGSLADDADFQKLTAATGDPGVATFYASPDAAKYAEKVASAASGFGPMLGFAGDTGATSPSSDVSSALAGFEGMAVTVRFASGSLEVESAGGSAFGLDALYQSGRGGDQIETLPADTAVAIGVGLDPGWFTQVVDRVAAAVGEDPHTLLKDASDTLGIDAPADVETLFGDSAALGFSSQFDPESFFDSTDSTGFPIAMKVHGDPAKIKAVLAKLSAGNPQEPDMDTLLGTDEDGQTIVIGPDADYRKQVLTLGTLGHDKVYQDVVRESDQASAIFFVDFDAGDWLAKLAGNDQELKDNLAPLAGFGVTAWKDGDYLHSVLRLTTD